MVCGVEMSVGGRRVATGLWDGVAATMPPLERLAVYLNDKLGSITICQMETILIGEGVNMIAITIESCSNDRKNRNLHRSIRRSIKVTNQP